MRNRTTVAAVFALALLAPLAVLAARRPVAAPGGLLERAAVRLDLTAEQKSAIRDVLASHRLELRRELGALKSSRQELWDAIHADVADEAAIRAAAGAVGRAEGELAVTRAAMIEEVHAVLTPDQEQELEAMLADLRAFAEGFLERLRSQVDLALAD